MTRIEKKRHLIKIGFVWLGFAKMDIAFSSRQFLLFIANGTRQSVIIHACGGVSIAEMSSGSFTLFFFSKPATFS